MGKEVEFTPEGEGKIWYVYRHKETGKLGMDFVAHANEQKKAGWEVASGPVTLKEAQERLGLDNISDTTGM